jgi:anti-sigma factor ChrR (cupin superfamily)
MSTQTPGAKPTLDEVLMQSNELPWRPKSLQGVSEKMLWRDEATGASIALIKFAKGASIPEHCTHRTNSCFVFRESTSTPRPASC